jgi:hypothetical protein
MIRDARAGKLGGCEQGYRFRQVARLGGRDAHFHG